MNSSFCFCISERRFLVTILSSSKCFFSELRELRVFCFDDFPSIIVFRSVDAEIALYRFNSRSINSCRNLLFLSSSNSSILFLTSPIFANAMASFWSAVVSCFSASFFFSSKSDRPIKSSITCLFSSPFISDIR